MDTGRKEKLDGSLKRTSLDPRLVDKLCCPACKEELRNEDGLALLCTACARKYPIIAGIPDLAYYPEEDAAQAAFDAQQAKYEREVHDRGAHDYEERGIKVHGDKTELIATSWAKAFQGPVLDYGCGTGQLSRVLKRYHSPVYAFDISPNSVAKNVGDNKALAVAGNAFHLPFKDRCFETVCCNGVLHHLVNLRSAINEMARVANESIAISEPCTFAHHQTPWRTIGFPTDFAKAVLRAVIFRAFCLYEAVMGHQETPATPDGQWGESKYERPLEPQEVIGLLAQAGFRLTMLRFWTSGRPRRRSRIKKFLIRLFVSSRVGNVLEVRAERFGKGEVAASTGSAGAAGPCPGTTQRG